MTDHDLRVTTEKDESEPAPSPPTIQGKRILLTGGAGFIGTALTRRLVDENEVVIYDNGHRDALSQSTLRSHPHVHVVKGDVLDYEHLRATVGGCQMIVHLAAIAGVDTVLRMPVHTMKVALLGTYHVLEAALTEPQIERVIDFSTSEVFGTYAFKVREGDGTTLGSVGAARWTYAVSKLASEHMAHNYREQYGLPALSIRPFNIYGPGQVGEGAIHRFIVRALRNEDLEIHNDGSQIRAWCYIDDIINGILLCLARPEAVGQVFNVGNPRSVCTVHELARQVIRSTGSRSRLQFVRREGVDVEVRIPNIDKARELLGFEPTVDLEEGLQRTVSWYRQRAAA